MSLAAKKQKERGTRGMSGTYGKSSIFHLPFELTMRIISASG
jgi:hypothetical protein